MKAIVKTLKAFAKNDAGLETVEWAILAAIIVAGVAGVIASIGTNVTTQFNAINTATH